MLFHLCKGDDIPSKQQYFTYRLQWIFRQEVGIFLEFKMQIGAVLDGHTWKRIETLMIIIINISIIFDNYN